MYFKRREKDKVMCLKKNIFKGCYGLRAGVLCLPSILPSQLSPSTAMHSLVVKGTPSRGCSSARRGRSGGKEMTVRSTCIKYATDLASWHDWESMKVVVSN